MARVFLVSDLHLGHKSMALKRGFMNVEEHDKHIISQWNSVVTNKDIVYLLGDVTMESRKNIPLLGLLNGTKYLIGGNHDRRQDTHQFLEEVKSISGCTTYKGYIVTHIPIHPSEVGRFRGNIHGHLHDLVIYKNWFYKLFKIKDKRYLNVSLEQINYTPILLENLIKN